MKMENDGSLQSCPSFYVRISRHSIDVIHRALSLAVLCTHFRRFCAQLY